MRFVALIALVSGCFYVDPINQRPSIDIHQQSPADIVHRSDPVVLDAVYDDPEKDAGTFAWNVYLCGPDANDCDPTAKFTGTQPSLAFQVPVPRANPDMPVQALRVTLDATDDLGARARPQQELVIPVVDAPPTVELHLTPRTSYVKNTDIDIFAKVGDPDDMLAKVVVDQPFKVYTPNTQPPFELVDLAVPDPGDPTHKTLGQTLTPHGTGTWQVAVTATDPAGVATTEMVAFDVKDDAPPCLAQWQPATGGTLPLSDPTVFSVPLVTDDLDVYPPDPSDRVLGTTTFQWSLKRNAGVRQPLTGATGNSIDFDPAAFTPGDIVEIRVEIFDRAHLPPLPGCAPDAPECSILGQPMCTQRETWRVEVR